MLKKTLRALGLRPAKPKRPTRKELERLNGVEVEIPEITPFEVECLRKVRPYTMTTVPRLWSMIQSVRYLDANGIAGDIVECGVWAGGNLFLASMIHDRAAAARRFWYYDTFAGMSEPTEADVSVRTGKRAAAKFKALQKDTHNDWRFCSLDGVRANAAKAGVMSDDCVFVQGKVEDTLRDLANIPERIALLRLDTDWYESTKAELDVLYPRLSPGGILLVDDYGDWQGARQAVDAFFQGRHPFLHRVDRACRLYVKPSN